MTYAAATLWCILGMAACKVVVLGDSNTCLWPTGCLETNALWPLYVTQLPGWPGWDVVNRAVPNMVAGRYPRDGLIGASEPADGAWHLERIIRDDLADACTATFRGIPIRPKLVIALGTNDLARPNISGLAAGLTVTMLYDQAVRVPCVDVYVATIPPRVDVDPQTVRAANMMIELHVPADHVVPFGLQPVSDLKGGAHMTEVGHRHRAELALPVLFPTP